MVDGNKPAYMIENAVVTVISEPRSGVSVKTGNPWEMIAFNVQMNCGEGVTSSSSEKKLNCNQNSPLALRQYGEVLFTFKTFKTFKTFNSMHACKESVQK